MSSVLDRLNLRPNERRLVVFVAVVVFIVLNVWFVWPHYGDFARARGRLARAQQTLAMFTSEIKQLSTYEERVRVFERENPAATRDDQSIEMLKIIQEKAFRNGINIISYPRSTTRTNEFFVEQIQPISLQAPEDKLVDFLYDLGTGESTIRVRGFSLRPDQARQQLGGNLSLVASYQRKLPAPRTPSATGPAEPAKPSPAAAATNTKPATAATNVAATTTSTTTATSKPK